MGAQDYMEHPKAGDTLSAELMARLKADWLWGKALDIRSIVKVEVKDEDVDNDDGNVVRPGFATEVKSEIGGGVQVKTEVKEEPEDEDMNAKSRVISALR